MRWDLKPADERLRAELCKDLGLSAPTVSALINRGITTIKDAERFFSGSLQMLHDPALLPDMDRGLERISKALARKERIAICGDYDVDGLSATALLILFFRQIGVEVACRIPHRINDGYGLNRRMIESLAGDGVSLIITVDNGTSNIDEIEHARSLGIDIVVTDHHEVGGRDIGPEHIIINPKRRDSRFPFPDIAGVGVAFHLLMGLRRHLRENGSFKNGPDGAEPPLRNMLDLVALGTIGDVVPLIDANRLFVRHGLVELARSSLPGIVALKGICGLDKAASEIDPTAVAFRLAPRINAAGRLADPSIALRLLITNDPVEAAALAEQLHSLNSQRQGIESKILDEAISMITGNEKLRDPNLISLASDSWHPGVIGIVASRLAERYQHPAVILTKAGDEYRGSLRSIGSYNIVSALQAVSGHLLRFGGHHAAAGVCIKAERIEPFFADLAEHIGRTFNVDEHEEGLRLDAEVSSADLTESFLLELDRLRPYGEGNEEPIFCIRGAKIPDKRIVGNDHLKFKVVHSGRSFDAIGFGLGGLLTLDAPSYDIAFTPQINEWEGRRSIQLKVFDLKPSC